MCIRDSAGYVRRGRAPSRRDEKTGVEREADLGSGEQRRRWTDPAEQTARVQPRCPYPLSFSPASATCSGDSSVGDSPGTEDAVSHRRHIHSSWAVRS